MFLSAGPCSPRQHVARQDLPAAFAKDQFEATDFYVNRIMMEYKSK